MDINGTRSGRAFLCKEEQKCIPLYCIAMYVDKKSYTQKWKKKVTVIISNKSQTIRRCM